MKKNGSYVHVYIYVKSLDVNYRRISKNDILFFIFYFLFFYLYIYIYIFIFFIFLIFYFMIWLEYM